MAKTQPTNEDLASKLADLGRAGSTAMQPAVTKAMVSPVTPTKPTSRQKPMPVILVKTTVRLTPAENKQLLRMRNELSDRFQKALTTTDVLRLALNAFDHGRSTAAMIDGIRETDRRRKSD